jgi:hypothetical protein
VFRQIEEDAEGVVLAEAFGVVEEKAPVDRGDEEGEGGGTRREEPANFISWKKKNCNREFQVYFENVFKDDQRTYF